MGSKDYNVDDILSEIKKRKSLEKAGKAAPEAGSASEDLRFEFPRPEPPPPEPPPPEPPPRPKPQPVPAPVPAPKQRPEKPARQSHEPETFRFNIDGQDEEKPHNPMDFDGHVRPITDKAKLRGNRMDGTKQLPKFDFNAAPPEEPPAPPPPPPDDPVKFRPRDTLKTPPKKEVISDQTRIMPSMRDIKTGDIRKMDFGRIANESEHEPYYEENEIDDIPEGSVVDYSEYNSASDRRDVQLDIAKVKLWLFIRVAATLVLTVILLMFTLWGKYENVPLLPKAFEPVSGTMRAYLLVCTIITILIALVGSSAVGGGLIGLFKMHANSDTLAACAILAAVGQGVAAVANPEAIQPAKMNLYFFIAALTMLFNAIGKMMMISRIMENFKIISTDKPKKALLAVESDEFCREFFRDDPRRPTIAYGVKTGFFTDFLALSYSDKYDVGINRTVAPVCLAGAFVVSVLTYFLAGGMFSAVSALTAVLCVCATLSTTFIENIPLSKLTKKLAPQGGMVSGTKAVEDFCDTKALVLTENDLFPVGNVRLHGIKAFSQGRIDEAILDAASVLCAMDGALGPVFLDMIGGNKKLLKRVDNIVFENSMGISAWVNQRRVLIGNRKLMLNHGIILPPEVLNQKQPQITTDSEPLFLSNSGEASAMFTVSYHIDEELAVQLDQMAVREKLLIVHTTDANITAEKIWELYGYPLDLVRILPAEWHPKFQQMSQPRDKAVAEIAFTNQSATLVKAVLACITARSSILWATIIQLIQIVMGYGLVTFMAFMGSIGSLAITEICIYQIFWFLAIFIVQKMRQS